MKILGQAIHVHGSGNGFFVFNSLSHLNEFKHQQKFSKLPSLLLAIYKSIDYPGTIPITSSHHTQVSLKGFLLGIGLISMQHLIFRYPLDQPRDILFDKLLHLPNLVFLETGGLALP